MSMSFSHVSVLLNETVSSLNIKPDGVYVDCTTGGAGHSKEILKHLGEKGKLICFDQDPDAIEIIKQRIGDDPRVIIIHSNFVNLKEVLMGLEIEKVDGIMADLGVSSHQLDKGERGFSYNSDAPLDMRMSQEGLSAHDVVNTYSYHDLTRILREYGEEKFASRIANNIINQREIAPIQTTFELAELVKNSIPAATRRTGPHPARRSFQAIRLEVNGELEKLSSALGDMFDSLNVDGRVSIITFHSLEDKIVKKKFQEYTVGCTCPKDFPICVCNQTPRGKLPFKFVKPSTEEIEVNQRSRSATLRVIEKLKD